MRLFQLTVFLWMATFLYQPSTLAQSQLARHSALDKAVLKPAVAELGRTVERAPASNTHLNHIPGVTFRSAVEFPIGMTTYDLQTNSSMARRLSRTAEGQIMATWTQGLEQPPSFPDRGTGYNRFDGNNWGDQPATRLEASLRTGWPSHVVTASGKEVIVCHVFSPPVRPYSLRRNGPDEAWIEADVPVNAGPGTVWPRIAVGGPDGEAIHMIAITYPVANGGVEYEGVDGHILYYRSLDAGATWDITDAIIPGLDSEFMSFQTADAYAIDARGETVAIAVFNGWGDINVYKSTDNGNTWETMTAYDFPLERYQIDQGYTLEDLPPYDPAQPDSLAIFTSDDSGALLLDQDGMAHIFFGQMYLQDEDLTDGGWTFYPATSGIAYWNESFGPDSIRTIADVEDLNGNDTLDVADIANIAGYGLSLTSHPSAGIDALGNIYLGYSSLMEGEAFINLEDNQHYRHVYLTASRDGGATWETPYDIINEDISLEPDLIAFTEAAFPALARDVGNTVELIYQQDFRPGLSVQGDLDPAEANFINFVSVPLDVFGVVGTEEAVQAEYFQLDVQPNPAHNEAWVSFELERNARYALSLHNLMGQKVADVESDDAFGHNLQRINLSGLQSGVYLVRLQAEDKVAVARLMVR
ncbi:MAG: T9SS type A sorting domain-containing protein [Lewinellaceae bacterium]|nr:T9SS type A sorting domain-containing protein [Phaeodactylibacter sp.]MCB9351044.1 T9SS type A sorting domain-containing protein [Lewinellaceae bacterium]